jgi:hypothetical protein
MHGHAHHPRCAAADFPPFACRHAQAWTTFKERSGRTPTRGHPIDHHVAGPARHAPSTKVRLGATHHTPRATAPRDNTATLGRKPNSKPNTQPNRRSTDLPLPPAA